MSAHCRLLLGVRWSLSSCGEGRAGDKSLPHAGCGCYRQAFFATRAKIRLTVTWVKYQSQVVCNETSKCCFDVVSFSCFTDHVMELRGIKELY